VAWRAAIEHVFPSAAGEDTAEGGPPTMISTPLRRRSAQAPAGHVTVEEWQHGRRPTRWRMRMPQRPRRARPDVRERTGLYAATIGSVGWRTLEDVGGRSQTPTQWRSTPLVVDAPHLIVHRLDRIPPVVARLGDLKSVVGTLPRMVATEVEMRWCEPRPSFAFSNATEAFISTGLLHDQQRLELLAATCSLSSFGSIT
jgi:hypothetical protein